MTEKSYYQIRLELEEARLRAMADAFLCWKLPQDFAPDCGISFTPPAKPHPEALYTPWPIGTNLLTFPQALAMIKEIMPPECFGLDDCSSNALSVCKWADRCGK